jgi:hypothetical protein
VAEKLTPTTKVHDLTSQKTLILFNKLSGKETVTGVCPAPV